MKTIYHYIDYRLYLREYYVFKKETTRFFSYRYFSSKAGISSPVFLKLVMEGKSNISLAMIDKFNHALQLNKSESRYFKHLVLFNQAVTADEKQDHYAVLVSLQNSISHHVLGSEQFEYLAHWYTVVIRELVCMGKFDNDYAALAASLVPPITKREVESSMKLLLRLNMIEPVLGGGYRQTNRALATNRDVAGTAIKAFNKAMIDLAHKSVDAVENTERNVSGMTLGVSRECYDALCAEIETFKIRVASIVDNNGGSDRVYQMNIQLFPVGKVQVNGDV